MISRIFPRVSGSWISSYHRSLLTIPVRSLSLAYNCHEPPAERKKTDETPIVILHGLFGSKQNSRGISRALAWDIGAPVYAIDLRNHGDSPHDGTHDYIAMANDVNEFFLDHDLHSVSLIGHSMGAKVAMVVAIQTQSKVANLIPVDNAPVDALLKNDFHKYIRGMRSILDAHVTKHSEADSILEGYEDSAAIRQFLLTNLIRDLKTKELKFRIPIKILSDALDNMGDFPFKNPQGHRFNGRTLIVRGTKSHYVADDVLPLIGEFFPAFQLADIDSGHWVISEKPEAFRKIVVDFLLQSKD